jgi:hypothetical protein
MRGVAGAYPQQGARSCAGRQSKLSHTRMPGVTAAVAVAVVQGSKHAGHQIIRR